MKTHYRKLILSAIAFSLLFSACGERVAPGQYKIMGVELTPEAKTSTQTEAMFKSMPVFTFTEGGKVKIKPDFSFGYFKDSLFTYQVKDGYLYLKGKNSKHKIMCESYTESERPSYELYLDTEYVIQIQIVKEK